MKRNYTLSKMWLFFLLLFFALPAMLQAQEKTVRGKVTTYSDGTGLPGVSIRVKGTGTGTTTDFEGNYQLSVSEDATLVFSFVGFTPEEIVVGNQTRIDVALVEDIATLSEVVVVGYGTQRKSDLTGSVTAIGEKDFVEGFVATPDQLITGKVAGVQITSNGGAPGSGSTIRIRGGASLNASNDPLIVVDGVPLSNQGIAGASNALSFINPDDIESMNILKDASATAIYGSRASNGVIIITTKNGKAGEKLQVNFNSLHSLSTVVNTIDVLSAEQFRAAVMEYGTEAQQALLGPEGTSTEWQDLIYRDAYSTDNNLSLSGTVKDLPYRLSLGYLNQDGILLTSNFERSSAALTLNPSFLDDHLKVDLNVRGIVTNSRFANQGAIGSAIAMDPTKPVYIESDVFGGYYQWTRNGNFNPLAPVNPLSLLEQTEDEGRVFRSIGNLSLDYKFHFLPALKANLNLGYDITDSEGQTFQPADFGPVVVQGGLLRPYAQSKTNKLLDFYLNYGSELDEINSRLDVTAGYSYQSFTGEDPSFDVLDAEGNPIPGEEAGLAYYPQNNLISFFARANYVFNERYLVTATVRRDGSSRFSEDNRWGTFPALALAWRINEEAFLVDSDVVSNLKLRLGYGITGQQDVFGDFPYLARYTFSNVRAQYQFGDRFYNMFRPEAYDPNIKWEETTTYNAGIDFGFLSNRITGSVDYFSKQTDDLLAVVPTAAGTNFSNELLTNVGSLESEGVEVAFNFIAVENENLSWEVGLNGTYNDITILSLSRVDEANPVGIPVGGIAGGTGNTLQIQTVGYAPYTFYVYKQVYGEDGTPIEGLFADLNEDGQITENDRYRFESPNANMYYGISSQLGYKNWSLSFVGRGSWGNYLYNNINSGNANYANFASPGFLGNATVNVLETNFETRNERILLSDYFVENASFFRMDNINLGYDFGRVINDKMSLRLNANVQNAFVITEYSGLDPEIGGGIDNTIYPRPRVYAVGINVAF